MWFCDFVDYLLPCLRYGLVAGSYVISLKMMTKFQM